MTIQVGTTVGLYSMIPDYTDPIKGGWIRTSINIEWDERPAKWQDLGLSETSISVYNAYLDAEKEGTLTEFKRANSDYQKKWLDKILARRYIVRYSGYKIVATETVGSDFVDSITLEDNENINTPEFRLPNDETQLPTGNVYVTGVSVIDKQDGFSRIEASWVEFGQWNLRLDPTFEVDIQEST